MPIQVRIKEASFSFVNLRFMGTATREETDVCLVRVD
jgi:hypothetical protein